MLKGLEGMERDRAGPVSKKYGTHKGPIWDFIWVLYGQPIWD